jgi:tetratricopeptide (TPR) repeat protein
LALQREVAEAIAQHITMSLAIAPSDLNADARRHSTIAEANEHYLRGRYYWSKDTCRRTHESGGALSQSDRSRPFIRVGAQRSGGYLRLARQRRFMPMRDAYPLARTAALKALELNDALAEAHNSMAAITADYYWDWVEADRHYKRAVALNPNYDIALSFIRSISRAWDGSRKRSPSPGVPNASIRCRRWTQMNVGMILYFARRYDDAVVAIKETLDLDPDFGPRVCHVGSNLHGQRYARSSSRGTGARSRPHGSSPRCDDAARLGSCSRRTAARGTCDA